MGVLVEGLDGHEGYADRRLPDGRLAGGVWTHQTSGFTAYVAACGCGWTSQDGWPPTQQGEQAALADWHAEHADPLLAQQTKRRHLELARLLEWLGDQAGRLHHPATVDRVLAGLDHAWDLAADLQRDLQRQAPNGRPTVSDDRPLGAWPDRRVVEHGRAICRQRALPTHPEVAIQQAAVLEEWARRWRQCGPRDLFGEVELGLIGELAAELRRIAAGLGRQLSPKREVDDER